MDFEELRSKIRDAHIEVPQRSMLAQMALDQIQAGLTALAGLGHRLHVEQLEAEPVIVFPKMLYKDGEPERVVTTTEDFHAALDDGWREHPTEPDVEVGPRPNGHPEMAAPALAEPHPAVTAMETGIGGQPLVEPQPAASVPSAEELEEEAQREELAMEFDAEQAGKADDSAKSG